MTDEKKDSKEYITMLIYRCSNCGVRIERKSEDEGIGGFNEKFNKIAPELGKRQFIRRILGSNQNLWKPHECGGDNTVQWGRLELVAVTILEKVER